MYFEEGLKLDIIRDTLKDSEESIKSVILHARQKALKILAEKDICLHSTTPDSIKNFIHDFRKGELKQKGLNEKAVKHLLTNMFQLVLDDSQDKDKMKAPDIADQFPEFRLEKFDDALSDPKFPNQLTGRELQRLRDFIKKLLENIKVHQATPAFLSVYFVYGFSH
jgi:hypothetical protein